MQRRLPSTPPNLPGFSYLRVLGSGGFADVFLYQQDLPRRQVAVKVLLAEVVNDQVRQSFQAEANLMASLSSHPSILTVFQAGVSADGRPYLVMEQCSPALSQRYRTEPLGVPEVLQVGITIANAVQAAHQAGMLHRDLKPSNILVTRYGHAVLGDFGIAATVSDARTVEAIGLSIPWSAPEVLVDEVSGSVASEVWSLGATLYSFLTGRSPFEIPGSENSSAQLISRINKARVPAIGRPDVPGRLELILQRSMSRRPESRQGSVLELIRELQSVEAELGLLPTRLEVADEDWAGESGVDDEDRTRISAVNSINAYREPRRRRAQPAARGRRSTAGALADTSGPRGTAGSDGSAGSLGTGGPSRDSGRGTARGSVPGSWRRSALVWALVAASVIIVVLAVVTASALSHQATPGLPTVSNVTGEVRDGMVVFGWADPGIAQGDSYVVTLRTGESSIQKGTEFSVDPHGQARVCASVAVNRDGRTGSASGEKCVDTGGSVTGSARGGVSGVWDVS
ncbi:serine/threonine protein kinase [Cryobacterium algoricola]|uniref:non-specific serine/threonine protein kinase n=1 Tax=Cryobacterium algoricola TaxID=1259183 RepID=A0ABY2IGW7_9MICO|nr:serine/threonine-protein kinase [Cryobacterium algoricola]TFB90801.1 serine/threonine protein kinase [Cryobacterium algoricola]